VIQILVTGKLNSPPYLGSLGVAGLLDAGGRGDSVILGAGLGR